MTRVFITGSANCDPVMAVACAMRAMSDSRAAWSNGHEEMEYVTGLSPTGVEAAVRYLHGASLSPVRTIDVTETRLADAVDRIVYVSVSEVIDGPALTFEDFGPMRVMQIEM